MRMLFVFLVFLSFAPICNANEYDSLIKVSRQYRNVGQYQKAINNYLYLLDKVEPNSIEQAYLHNVLGNAYSSLSNKQKALDNYYAAVKINLQLNNKAYLWKNYSNLSDYYQDEGQFEKAKEYLKMALEVLPKEDPDYGFLLMKLGQTYASQYKENVNNGDTASVLFVESIGLLKKNKLYGGLTDLYISLANLYLDQGHFQHSVKYQKKAMDLADSIDYRKAFVVSLRNLGKSYLDYSQYDSANKYLELSLQYSTYYKSPTFQTNLYHNLIKLYMAKGELEKASSYFQSYNNLRDSINDQEVIKRLKEMEIQYDTQLKDLAIVEQEKTIKATLFEKRIFLFLSLFLFILISLVIWFFYQKQRYLKQLKQEEISNMKKDQELRELNAMMHGQEEERNRIANDLHDRLGARLSSIKLHLQGSELSKDQLKFVNHIDEAIKETREISHNLSTDLLTRFGISTALKDVIRSINESGKIIADVALFGVEKRWPLEVERNAYFILLELINNTLKHSQAKSFMIQVNQVDEEVNIFYEDDGLGFDPKKVIGKGLGMRSLNARINSLNGSLDFNSQPGNGVQVVITFQLDQLLDKKTDTIKTLSNE